jgi:hypothetical protein
MKDLLINFKAVQTGSYSYKAEVGAKTFENRSRSWRRNKYCSYGSVTAGKDLITCQDLYTVHFTISLN